MREGFSEFLENPKKSGAINSHHPLPGEAISHPEKRDGFIK
jgi:hypothetical protein